LVGDVVAISLLLGKPCAILLVRPNDRRGDVERIEMEIDNGGQLIRIEQSRFQRKVVDRAPVSE